VETNFGKFMGLVDYFFRVLNFRNFLNNETQTNTDTPHIMMQVMVK
jgi:hypothetical protein